MNLSNILFLINFINSSMHFVRDSHKYLNCGASFSKREFNRRHRYAARRASQGSDERPHARNSLSRPDAPTVKIGCFYSSEEARHFGCLAAPHLARTLLVFLVFQSSQLHRRQRFLTRSSLEFSSQ